MTQTNVLDSDFPQGEASGGDHRTLARWLVENFDQLDKDEQNEILAYWYDGFEVLIDNDPDNEDKYEMLSGTDTVEGFEQALTFLTVRYEELGWE